MVSTHGPYYSTGHFAWARFDRPIVTIPLESIPSLVCPLSRIFLVAVRALRAEVRRPRDRRQHPGSDRRTYLWPVDLFAVHSRRKVGGMVTSKARLVLPMLRNSERSDFKRCPQRWWWGWRQGLVPQGPPDINLWFGEGIHLALALWYKPGLKRGVDPRRTWKKFISDDIRFIETEFAREYDPKEYVEAGEFGVELLGNYLEEYGRDRSWDIIAPEQNFELVIPDKRGRPVVRLHGTMDGVLRDLDDGNVKILENKTAKEIITAHLELDSQHCTYFTVAERCLKDMGLIKPTDRVTDMVYNFLRKGHADDRPVNDLGQALNKDGSVSKNQPKSLFLRHPVALTRPQMRRQLEKIAAEVRAMNMMRSRELDLWKNETRNCHWDCNFYQMCVLDESEDAEDVLEFQRAVYRVRDPYASHRKSAA